MSSDLDQRLSDFDSLLNCSRNREADARTFHQDQYSSRFRIDQLAQRIIRDFEVNRCSIEEVILETFHAPLSLSSIQALLTLLGQGARTDAIDNCVRRAADRIRLWNDQPIPTTINYLLLGSVPVRARSRTPFTEFRFHVAFGCAAGGTRHALGARHAADRDEVSWHTFLDHLKRRGLRDPRLVVVPPDDALIQITATQFPGAMIQVSVIHLLQELQRLVRREFLPGATSRLRAIHNSSRSPHAEAAMMSFASEAESMASDGKGEILAQLLRLSINYLKLPWPDRELIRTNRMLKETAAALRQHTCAIGAAMDQHLAELLLLARLRWLNVAKWGGKRATDKLRENRQRIPVSA